MMTEAERADQGGATDTVRAVSAGYGQPGGVSGAGPLRTIPEHAVWPVAVRTLLVIGDDRELATALRDRLDRAYLTVLEVRADEAPMAVRACSPWPWMVVGTTTGLDPITAARLRRSPVLVAWRGRQPPGLPLHTVAVERFSEAVTVVEAALRAEVGGVRLAVGDGVTTPGGIHARNAPLEALVAQHPHPLFAPSRHFSSAARVLAAHHIALRIVQLESGGRVLAGLGR